MEYVDDEDESVIYSMYKGLEAYEQAHWRRKQLEADGHMVPHSGSIFVPVTRVYISSRLAV